MENRMTALNGKPKRKQSAKAQLTEMRAKRELLEETYAVQMLESVNGQTPWGRVVPPRQVVEPEWQFAQASVGPAERHKGIHPIAFQTEQDLRDLQAMGRWLADANPQCTGILDAITNYVIGTGFTYRVVAKPRREVPKEQLQLCQDVIDEFQDRNEWWGWEQEFFRRDMREGEHFRRYYYDQTGRLDIRCVEPEHVLQPSNRVFDGEWAFGVHTDPDDQQTRLGYWVSLDGSAANGDEVPASEMRHSKANVDRLVRRGLSDFFCVTDTATDLDKLLRNVRRGGSILAAIAWIEHHKYASKSQVESFADTVAQRTSIDPVNGSTVRQEKITPGTVVRTGEGKTYEGSPLAQNTMNFVEIARLARQSLCARWNAPESITGDASNGSYSSLVVAESPFVHRAKCKQQYYAWEYRGDMRRALAWAASVGYRGLTPELVRSVDVHVQPPALVVRDTLKEAQTNEIELRNGVLSPQDWAEANDRELTDVLQNTAKAKADGWVMPNDDLVSSAGYQMPSQATTSSTVSPIAGPASDSDAIDAQASAGDVAGTALNGAQITSLLSITDKVALGQIGADAAIAIIKQAFPLMDPIQIVDLIQKIQDGPKPAMESAAGIVTAKHRELSERFGPSVAAAVVRASATLLESDAT